MIAKLLNPNGVVADRVEVTIARDYRRVDQSEGWRGEAWLSTDIQVIPGEAMTLEVGGVASPIVIERVTVDSKAGQMLVRFTGSGSVDGLRDGSGS